MSNGNNINLSKNGENGGAGAGRPMSRVDDEDRKLFLGGLSWDTTEGDLRDYFSKYGDVENVSVKFDAQTGKPRGFGFITFLNEKTIDAVLKDGPHTVKDKQIDPKRAKSRPICKKVFVGGIDSNIAEEDIKKYFSKYGKVEQIELPFDRTRGKRREFVFIIFDTEESAEKACREPKQNIGGRDCDIKKAQPQPVAQAQKQRAMNSYGEYPAADGYGTGQGYAGRPSRGRGGMSGSRGGHASTPPSYGGYTSGYGDGYGAPSNAGYGYDGYGYSSAAPTSGSSYSDYYGGYGYGQDYNYSRSGYGSYGSYPGYESGAGDGAYQGYYDPAEYPPPAGPPSTHGPPPPAHPAPGKVPRGKPPAPGGYHPYARNGPPPTH